MQIRSLERTVQIADFRVRFAEPPDCRPLSLEEFNTSAQAVESMNAQGERKRAPLFIERA